MKHRQMDRWAVLRLLLAVSLAAGLWISSPTTLAGSVGYVGHLNPRLTVDLEDGWTSAPDPYRLAELALFASTGEYGWYLSGAVDSRGEELGLSLREAYVDGYFPRVDLRAGRQVLAWGAVDGNNPVDNLNPVDLALAGPGIEPAAAKLPAAALRAVSYWGAYQDVRAELVLLPDFRGHELPEGAVPPLPIEDPAVELLEPDWGVRVQRSFDRFDLALSYFDGHERLPTPDLMAGKARYLPVEVVGLEGALFDLGNLTLRGEGAYFRTADKEGPVPVKNPYLQYALQMEYLWSMETTLTLQYLASWVTGIESEFEAEVQAALPFGAGAPIFNLASEAVAAGFRRETTLPRETLLSLAWQGIFGLDQGGFLTAATADLALTDNFSLLVGLTTAEGLEGSALAAATEGSQVWTGVEYSF